MAELNFDFIVNNLRDVREQIDELVKLAEAGDLDDVNFELKMEHAYHHLNFAWNIRHVPPDRASRCVAEDFNDWSMFPSDLEIYKIG